MIRTLSCLVLLLSSGSALAEDSGTNDCHLLSTDYIRLMCYDKSTGYTKPASQVSPSADRETPTISTIQGQKGKQWVFSTEKSALRDKEDVFLVVGSANMEGNQIGSPERAHLWLACKENTTNVVIGFSRYTADDQTVAYKLDADSVQEQWMEIARGGEGIGLWSGSRAIPFIKQMLNKSTLIVGYDTYSGSVEFTFDISGLSSKIGPLAAACGWEP